MKKTLLIAILLLIPITAHAGWFGFSWGSEPKTVDQPLQLGVSVIRVNQGGTGAASFTAGECLKGNGTGAITTGSCGSGGGEFAWTPTSWGNATSTTLGFHNGFLSTASSTIVGN